MTEKPITASNDIADSNSAYSPQQIAHRVESVGVSKARTDYLTVLVLSVLAGAFISLGAIFYLVVVTDSELGFGITRLIGGLSFSLGLVLVVVAGAELFTGNNLIAMAWASGKVTTSELMINWIIVYVGNVIGCLGTVAFVALADTGQLNDGHVAQTAMKAASAKIELSFVGAFVRGILCNALVCLAVWLAMAGRSVTDKIFAVIFPIAAFVTLGMEHSIANWFFLPYGCYLDAEGTFSFASAAQNLVAVTLGNIIGGTMLVASVYWLAYLRNKS